MKVGRITKIIVDTDRMDHFNTYECSQRKFVVSGFYPVDEEFHPERKPNYLDLYHPREEAANAFFSGMGADVSGIKTNIYNNAPMNQSGVAYPVIIFSPAFGVERDMYLFMIESLVENGFIVFTVGATYESVFTVFPDGEFIKQLDVISEIEGTDFTAWNRLLEVRVKDIRCLVDAISEINRTHEMLKGKLNVKRIGVIGHSLGGAAVFKAAIEDRRIEAGILLDASLHFLGEISAAIETPFLLLRQQASNYEMLLLAGMNEIIAREYIMGQKILSAALYGYKSFISIKGTNHMSFSDVPLHFHETDISDKHELINTLSIAFMKEFVDKESGKYTGLFAHGCPKGIHIINDQGDVVE